MMGERGGGGTHSLTGHGQWPLEGSGKTQTAIRWMSNGELTNPQLNMLDILCLFFRNIFSRQMCTCCIKVQACQGRVEQEEQRSDKFLSGRSDDCDQSGPGVISGRSQCPAATNCQMTPASGLTLTDDATDHEGNGKTIPGHTHDAWFTFLITVSGLNMPDTAQVTASTPCSECK